MDKETPRTLNLSSDKLYKLVREMKELYKELPRETTTQLVYLHKVKAQIDILDKLLLTENLDKMLSAVVKDRLYLSRNKAIREEVEASEMEDESLTLTPIEDDG